MNVDKLNQLEDTAKYLDDRTGFAATTLELISEFKRIQYINAKYLQVLEQLQDIDVNNYKGVHEMEFAIYSMIKGVLMDDSFEKKES